ncbi:hypothetical protein LSH36_12g22007 [Paralvinella palmiformis]|uniref:Uncharacterized protein n=1 Tax=Paralvinella palmiformis TaxID=53620 RepID=A0AAD9KCG6_9ANNE|nr:hypothetical protein LSH36_12g22007 [Paralvinella palmiformis]
MSRSTYSRRSRYNRDFSEESSDSNDSGHVSAKGGKALLDFIVLGNKKHQPGISDVPRNSLIYMYLCGYGPGVAALGVLTTGVADRMSQIRLMVLTRHFSVSLRRFRSGGYLANV